MTNESTITVDPEPEEQLTETPTVVVCEGDGGIAKGRELYRLAKREGIEERLCLIAVNSRTKAFSGLPDEMHQIELSLPDRQYQRRDKQNRYYLWEQDDIGSMPGARRIRRIARYYMDNAENIGSYERKLRRTIEEFVEGFLSDPTIDAPEAVNVFQFVAAGGGTGSGIMPMVTGMLKVITDDLTRKLDVGFEHWATVSLATLEDFWTEGTRPDVNWRYIANSLALLDEIRALTGHDDVEYPLTIPIMASEDGANIQRSAYRLDANPFSGVFLQRYDEDTAADNDQYRTAVNRTAATVVLEWMRKDQGDFVGLENEAGDLDDVFYEIRAASFEPPTDDVAQLLDAKRSQDAAEETLTKLGTERSELSTAIDQLAAGIDARQIIRGEDLVAAEAVESSEEPLGDGIRPVPEVVVTAFDRAREVASNISPAGSKMESIESQLEEHQARRSFSFHDRVDGDRLQRAVFLAAVEDVVRSALTNHQFSFKIREFVDEQEERITEFDSAFEPTATPKEQFIQTLEPLLEEQLETLEGRLGGFGLSDRLTNRKEYAKLKQQRDRTRSALDSFQRAEAEFDHLTQLAERLKEERTATVASLEEAHRELTAARSDIEDDITRVRQEQAAATDRIQRLEAKVLESPLEQNMTLPVSHDVQLQSDLFDEDPGISTLIDAGVIDRGTVTNQLRRTLEDSNLVDNILERLPNERDPAQGRLRMFCSADTRELIWEDAPDGDAPKTVAGDIFGENVKRVTCNDDRRVTILAVYGSVSLDNFDYGELRESLEHGRPELWGEEVDLRDCYAYPELLPPTHPVSIPRQVEDADISTRGDADD